MFSKTYTIFPLTILATTKTNSKYILATRGMLRPSALKFKPLKKKILFKLLKIFSIHRKVTFHGTDKREEQDILNIFGANTPTFVAGNIPQSKITPLKLIEKEVGKLKLVFLGRIHSIKNLHFLLTILKESSHQIKLSIIGLLEDEAYWASCQKIMKELPLNIEIAYLGGLPHHEIEQQIQANHFLALPTQGENFGHAIYESFAAGRPVIISDQTPWRNLKQKKIGWDISLNEPNKYKEAIENVAKMKQDTFDTWCKSSWAFSNDFIQNFPLKEKYLQLFSK